MVPDESIDVLFVVAPFREGMHIPRAFQMRLSTESIELLNEVIDSGEIQPFRVVFGGGTAIYFNAKAIRSRYGFIQLELSWP